MLGARAWEMGNTPTLWETESSSNGASDCVGAVTNFFLNLSGFVLEQQQLCVLCHLRVRSLRRHHQSRSLLTRHEPSRGAGRRRRLFVKFSEYFLPPLLFSEKCWPLVSRARLGCAGYLWNLSIQQTDNDRLARLPLLLHHYHTKTGHWLTGAGEANSVLRK